MRWLLLSLVLVCGCYRTMKSCKTECGLHGLAPKGVAADPNPLNGGQCLCGPVQPSDDTVAACTKDTECKGERVCRKGRCEDPVAEESATE